MQFLYLCFILILFPFYSYQFDNNNTKTNVVEVDADVQPSLIKSYDYYKALVSKNSDHIKNYEKMSGIKILSKLDFPLSYDDTFLLIVYNDNIKDNFIYNISFIEEIDMLVKGRGEISIYKKEENNKENKEENNEENKEELEEGVYIVANGRIKPYFGQLSAQVVYDICIMMQLPPIWDIVKDSDSINNFVDSITNEERSDRYRVLVYINKERKDDNNDNDNNDIQKEIKMIERIARYYTTDITFYVTYNQTIANNFSLYSSLSLRLFKPNHYQNVEEKIIMSSYSSLYIKSSFYDDLADEIIQFIERERKEYVIPITVLNFRSVFSSDYASIILIINNNDNNNINNINNNKNNEYYINLLTEIAKLYDNSNSSSSKVRFYYGYYVDMPLLTQSGIYYLNE